MTIEQMRNGLQEYCDNYDGECRDCNNRKFGFCDQYSIRGATDEIIEKWHKVFFPELYQTNETVNHPAHYQGKHECIDEMIALFGVEAVKHFCMCNVYKYRYRAANKNGQEDLDKADWYMDKLMKLEEKHD